MKVPNVFFAFVVAWAMIVAACVPDGEAEIRGYADRHGVSNAFVKYERDAKWTDGRSKIMNFYIFLILYSKELKNENISYYNRYDTGFLVYCARYFGEDLRESEYAIPNLTSPNKIDDTRCEKTFHARLQ